MKNVSLGIYNLIDKEKIDESIKRVLSKDIDYNTYSTPKGLKELREKISEFLMSNWECNVNYNNMLITSGSQQSINLVAYSLLEEGDTILIEEPTYFGAIEVFKKRNINLVGVGLKEDGVDINDLERKVKKYSPKSIYVTPTFNNPTGIAWTNQKRAQFLEIINKYNVLVLEDDPYFLINFTNEKYKSLYEINEGKNIIYLGTFSKIISPGINVGYILTEIENINKICSFKKSFDLCTSIFTQYVILDYLENYNLNELMKKRIPKYLSLLDGCLKKIKSEYNNEILDYTKPKGGLFFLVKFKNDIDRKCFESGSNYYLEGKHDNETRINICANESVPIGTNFTSSVFQE